MERLTAVLVILLLIGTCSVASAGRMPASIQMPREFGEFIGKDAVQVFHDEFDPPLPGWWFIDKSAYGPMFHPDAFNADTDPWGDCMPAGGNDGLSWWCGKFDVTYAGGDGYGNNWFQWLLYENIDVAAYPPSGDCLILTFHGRHDSEVIYDYTYVQAYHPVMGWTNLNPGYNGDSGGWFNVGMYGYVLDGSMCGGTDSYIQGDNTVDIRFLFVSGDGWSDADGMYNSAGGAFNVDAVQIFAFFAGTVFLLDCDQGLGVPGPEPSPAGNYWHLSQRGCITWPSPPNSYVCDNDPDTTALPGGLNCWLATPAIDITGCDECTVWYYGNLHFQSGFGAEYSHHVSLDSGVTWYDYGTYTGDNEMNYGVITCAPVGWFSVPINSLLATLPGRKLKFAFGVQTDPTGASGCAWSNSCWFAVEDVRITTDVVPGTVCKLKLLPSEVATYYPCGEPYDLSLWVENASDLGAFEICTGYDSVLVAFDSVAVDTFLGSTGRDVYSLDPVDCDPLCQIDGIRYGAYAAGAPSGPTGSGSLAKLYFSRIGDGEGADTLCLEDWELVDTQLPPGIIDVAEATGVSMVHRDFCFGDFNDDGDVTVWDIMQVAGRWDCCQGDPCYSDTFDVNLLDPGDYCTSYPDGCIGAADVQAVAGRWAQGCPDEGLYVYLPGHPLENKVTVSVSPEDLVICCAEGETGTFDVLIDNASDLGAFEIELKLDPEVVEVEDVTLGSFIGSTGRTVNPLGPNIDNETGLVKFGAWTLGQPVGPEGSGKLATVTVGIRECEKISPVSIVDAEVVDRYGWPSTLDKIIGGTVTTECPTAAGSVQRLVPEVYGLYPNIPNPSSPSTVISFGIPGRYGQSVSVELLIYNVRGQMVRRLADDRYGPGYHEIRWDGCDEDGRELPSGTYFCRMKAGGHIETSKIVLLR